MKKLFRCKVCLDFHFGVDAPEICPTCLQRNVYQPAEKANLLSLLPKKLPQKKLWRCMVCNDLHLGKSGPAICPTCGTKNAYVEINEREFRNLFGK